MSFVDGENSVGYAAENRFEIQAVTVPFHRDILEFPVGLQPCR